MNYIVLHNFNDLMISSILYLNFIMLFIFKYLNTQKIWEYLNLIIIIYF